MRVRAAFQIRVIEEMTVRISAYGKGATTTICVEGRLTAGEVSDLQRQCHETDGSPRLDLSGLLSADQEGIRALRLFLSQGIELFGASPYIRELLKR